MQRVRLQGLAVVHQATDLLGCRCQLCGADQHVGGLGCGKVVADRADAAEALYQYRQFPVGSALDKFFEAPEFDDVQPCLLDVQVFIL